MPELVFTQSGDQAEDRRVRRLAAAGSLRRIAGRVYTSNLRDPLEQVVERNIWAILGKLVPGAVISARSAALARPVRVEGNAGPPSPSFVFLTGPSRRSLSLPGVEVRIAPGSAPLSDDRPFQGLHLASAPRHLLENLMTSRDRSGMKRALGRTEVERFLVRQCDMAGEERLNAIRDRAREIAPAIGATHEFALLDGIIGALLRSREARLSTPAGLALARGEPIDAACVDRLNILFAYLRSTPLPERLDPGTTTPAVTVTAFIEAYFSNYIEGTRFLVHEAREIVFNGLIPETRPKDGRDVLSTFRLVSVIEDMRKPISNFQDFEASLKAHHRSLMEGRQEMRPGEFKDRPNQAGNTLFVLPEHVRGTLRAGFDLAQGLEDAFGRAVFFHFLIADVHPFADGNGRLSRIFMTRELVQGSRCRIIIPTVYRDDYLGVLRAMSRHNDPAPMVRCFDRAQATVASIGTRGVEPANLGLTIEDWARTNAFVEAGEHARWEEFDPGTEITWKNGIPAPEKYWKALALPRII